jgi:tetratricopeptide (TPR) repeat protein
MFETIREYGTDQLREHAETAALREQHAAYYLALAERADAELAGPDAATWLTRLDRDHDNLRGALDWVKDRGDGRTALRLATALVGFWHRRGHLGEGRQWLGAAFDLPGATVDSAASTCVRAHIGAATLAIEQASYDEAASHCDLAMALATDGGSPSDLIACLNTQGLLAREQDRYAESADSYNAALALARSATDRTGETIALLGAAYAAMFSGHADAAGALAEESLAIARQLGDRHLLGQVLFVVAWQEMSAGRYDQAEALGTEALSLFRPLGDAAQTGEVVFLMGNSALFRRDYEGAARCFEEALALNHDRGDRHRLARDLSALGAALLNLGQLAKARDLTAQSLTEARRHDDQWSSAMSLTILGHVDLAQGDLARARDGLAEASQLFLAVGNPMYLPWCLEGLACLAAASGHDQHAVELDAAREVLRGQVGMLPPLAPTAYERILSGVRTALPPGLFDEARAAAAARPVEDTIASALEVV